MLKRAARFMTRNYSRETGSMTCIFEYLKWEILQLRKGGRMIDPYYCNQRTNGPVNAHLISWPSKAQNIQNLEKYMVKKGP